MSSLDPTLVVGGCGSLGHHIVRKLLESGATNITVFDITVDNNVFPGVNYVKGSIESFRDILDAIQKAKPVTIFHTASPSMLGQHNTREIFDSVNIKGTQNIIDAIMKVGSTKALVYTSSSSVIHDNVSDLVYATEDMPYCSPKEQPVYYTYTKAEAEKMVIAANRVNGLLTAAIRACTLFGEGDNAMPTQIGSAKSGRGRLQVGDGKNMFDWTYIGNAAQAHLLAANALLKVDPTVPPRPEDEGQRVDGETFFITNDEPWPFWEFIRRVGAEAGYPVKKEDIRVIPAWLFYCIAVSAEWFVWATSFGRRESHLNRQMVRYLTMNRTFDITKAKKRLGYRPEVSMEEGIKRAVRAYMATQSIEGDKSR